MTISASEAWTMYQAQSDIVAKEKQILRELNATLLEARKTCKHTFIAGACTICGADERRETLLEQASKAQPKWPDPASYKFVD